MCKCAIFILLNLSYMSIEKFDFLMYNLYKGNYF